jgi:hypothetical protein
VDLDDATRSDHPVVGRPLSPALEL